MPPKRKRERELGDFLHMFEERRTSPAIEEFNETQARLRIAKSTILGLPLDSNLGLFARIDFPENDFILSHDGLTRIESSLTKRYTLEQMKYILRLPAPKRIRSRETFSPANIPMFTDFSDDPYSIPIFLDASDPAKGGAARYINDPGPKGTANARFSMMGHCVWVRAIRPIRANEEIFIDYGPNFIWDGITRLSPTDPSSVPEGRWHISSRFPDLKEFRSPPRSCFTRILHAYRSWKDGGKISAINVIPEACIY